MKLVSFLLVLNLLACMACLAQLRKCMVRLAEIKQIEQNVANSSLELERLPKLLETHFALGTAPRHLLTYTKTNVLNPDTRDVLSFEKNRQRRAIGWPEINVVNIHPAPQNF